MSVFVKAVFRVDESVELGFGHMARCSALAQALKNAGCNVEFYCINVSLHTRRKLEKLGIQVIDIKSDFEFLRLDLSEAVVVVDGYQFYEDFWKVLESIAKKTVYIDDYRGVDYRCNVLLCNNEGVLEEEISAPVGCRVFLGGRYILLRSDILHAAKMQRPCRRKEVIMLASGGTRQKAWIGRILKLLGTLQSNSKFIVLTGRRVSFANILRLSNLSGNRVRLLTAQSASQMIAHYHRARCLITPASTLMLEAFAAGCPIVSGWIAENQMNSLEFYSFNKLIANVGDLRHPDATKLSSALSDVLKEGAKMRLRQKKYISASCDGLAEVVRELMSVAS
jgi:UDP-2,4-diacetamido-2,4,6-trideoxy-beta-L-altropyranose hydrolase